MASFVPNSPRIAFYPSFGKLCKRAGIAYLLASGERSVPLVGRPIVGQQTGIGPKWGRSTTIPSIRQVDSVAPRFSIGEGVDVSIPELEPPQNSFLDTSFVPYIDTSILQDKLPIVIKPTEKSAFYYAARPNGLPLDVCVEASPDKKGITFNTIGYSFLGPLNGPRLKCGVGADIRVEKDKIKVDNPMFRIGVVVADFYFYLQFTLKEGVKARMHKEPCIKGHPLFFFVLEHQFNKKAIKNSIT